MTPFQNGHQFNLWIRRPPPERHALPYVSVTMAPAFGPFQPVIGKVDSGAARTILNFDTARALGIDDPTDGPMDTGTGRTATDHPFPCYFHFVWVQISDEAGQSILFPLSTAFADEVKRNLFGVDWLQHLCLAVDADAVHFLRD